MKKYFLMHKNRIVAGFVIDGRYVVDAFISKIDTDYVPLSFKKALHFKGYISSEEGNFFRLNEEGMYIVEEWLNSRSIPINRDNLKKYLDNKNDTVGLMLSNHSCSLTDCYWTMQVGENLTWDEVKLYGSSKIDVLKVIEKNSTNGTKYSGVNSTLGGCLEKYWFMSDREGLMLSKKTSLVDSILSVREIIASKIYNSIGYNNYCHYSYLRNRYDQVVGCKCKVFTSEKLELITAYDLLEEYGLSQSENIYEDLVRLAVSYGADEKQVRYQLDIQTMVDYLITNRDRHQNNIGFLRDSDTLKIVGIAPIFDSGSSRYLEGEKPEGVTSTTVHNLYNTELECLKHVSNLSALDLSKLPHEVDIFDELSNTENISEYRVDQLCTLYRDKVKFLEELQTGKRSLG